MLKKTPINSLNVSFVARNLAYLLKHTPGTSPEGGYDTTMFSQPSTLWLVPYTVHSDSQLTLVSNFIN